MKNPNNKLARLRSFCYFLWHYPYKKFLRKDAVSVSEQNGRDRDRTFIFSKERAICPHPSLAAALPASTARPQPSPSTPWPPVTPPPRSSFVSLVTAYTAASLDPWERQQQQRNNNVICGSTAAPKQQQPATSNDALRCSIALPQNSNNSISFIGSIKTRRGEQSNVFQRKSTASREDRP